MKFLAEADRLVITLEGWEMVWGLRRRLVIPKSNIIDMQWTPQFSHPGRLLRIGGTGIPGLLYAGNFRGNGEWYFVFLRQPRGWGWSSSGTITAPNVLAITTRAFPYQQILLTSTPEIGERLTEWYRSTLSPIQPSGEVPE